MKKYKKKWTHVTKEDKEQNKQKKLHEKITTIEFNICISLVTWLGLKDKVQFTKTARAHTWNKQISVESYPETNMGPTIFQVGHNKPKASDTVVEKKASYTKNTLGPWTFTLGIPLLHGTHTKKRWAGTFHNTMTGCISIYW